MLFGTLMKLLLTLVSHFPTGGDNQLQVSLQRSEPTAICYSTMSPSLQSSCANIVDNMPYDSYTNLFGPSDDPQVTVKLPLTLTSGTFVRFLHTLFALCASLPPPLQTERRNQYTPRKKASPPVQRSVNANPTSSRWPLRNDHLHPRPL